MRVIARYDDQLNGGVHNVFIHEGHVYALSNGRRYDIISIEDPTNPYRVGRFELDTPGHGVHDVWVVDGIAYSSNWHDGVVAVDVGGGGQGGAPNNPVKLGSYAYPSGWNHAAFPYKSQSTGKFYAFAGDEAFPLPEGQSSGCAPATGRGMDSCRRMGRMERAQGGRGVTKSPKQAHIISGSRTTCSISAITGAASASSTFPASFVATSIGKAGRWRSGILRPQERHTERTECLGRAALQGQHFSRRLHLGPMGGQADRAEEAVHGEPTN